MTVPVCLDQAQNAFLYKQPLLSIDWLRAVALQGHLISIRLYTKLKVSTE